MSAGRPSTPMAVVLLLVAALALSWTLPGVGPALRLATGNGRPGVFTAHQLECLSHPGHESCTWTGAFRSRDGLVHRPAAALAGSGRSTHRAGQRVAAADVGLAGRVYEPGGSAEWVFTVALALAELTLLVFALRAIIGRVRPRGRNGDGSGDHGRHVADDARLAGGDG